MTNAVYRLQNGINCENIDEEEKLELFRILIPDLQRFKEAENPTTEEFDQRYESLIQKLPPGFIKREN
jgi:hypothetical protein